MLDVGQIFRKRAVERGLTVAEYDKLVEANPEEDREIEEETKQFVEHCSSDIIVSRRM
jgi:cytidylate kinase